MQQKSTSDFNTSEPPTTVTIHQVSSISTVMENTRVAPLITNRRRRTLTPFIETSGDSSDAR